MQAKVSRGIVLAAAMLVGSSAWAVPISSSLSITGSVTLDTVTSQPATGVAHQNGTLTSVVGGTTSTASFVNTPASISPSSGLSGAVTEIGDGFGALFQMGGTATGSGQSGKTDPLFADFTLNFTNNSLTDSFQITLSALITNTVSASGDDAYSFSLINIYKNSVRTLFSEYQVDTLHPSDTNVNRTEVSATMSDTFVLAPGQSLSFSAVQEQRGGVFLPGSYDASLDAFLKVTDVVNLSDTGNAVPVPGSLPLALLGLLALVASRPLPRRRSPAAPTEYTLQGA